MVKKYFSSINLFSSKQNLETLNELNDKDDWAYDESDLEEKIIAMAKYTGMVHKFDFRRRRKRDSGEETKGGSPPKGILHPHAFVNNVGLGSIVDGVILSPFAFVTELLSYSLATVKLLIGKKLFISIKMDKDEIMQKLCIIVI